MNIENGEDYSRRMLRSQNEAGNKAAGAGQPMLCADKNDDRYPAFQGADMITTHNYLEISGKERTRFIQPPTGCKIHKKLFKRFYCHFSRKYDTLEEFETEARA